MSLVGLEHWRLLDHKDLLVFQLIVKSLELTNIRTCTWMSNISFGKFLDDSLESVTSSITHINHRSHKND